MILTNNSACLIAINTSPILTNEQVNDLRAKNRPVPSSFINIAPRASKEVPDKFCDTDFVRNLIKIGELSASPSKAKIAPKASEPKPKAETKEKAKPKSLTKAQEKALKQAREDAELNGVEYDEDWTAEQINDAINKA